MDIETALDVNTVFSSSAQNKSDRTAVSGDRLPFTKYKTEAFASLLSV